MPMPTLEVFPPNADNEALFATIPGLRQTPIPVIGPAERCPACGSELADVFVLQHGSGNHDNH